MNDNDKFHYTYSAPTEEERKEIKRLRSQYLPAPQEGALTRLKRLDKKARTIPTAISLTLGVVGTLIFGLGLSLILEFAQLLFGTLISVVGLVPLLVAYPVYNAVKAKCKKKYGEEILSLSETLLNESNAN